MTVYREKIELGCQKKDFTMKLLVNDTTWQLVIIMTFYIEITI